MGVSDIGLVPVLLIVLLVVMLFGVKRLCRWAREASSMLLDLRPNQQSSSEDLEENVIPVRETDNSLNKTTKTRK
jgi:Sec-independent protein translocase protein TatA